MNTQAQTQAMRETLQATQEILERTIRYGTLDTDSLQDLMAVNLRILETLAH